MFFYAGIAAGVVLTGLAGSLDAGIFTYLFGSILTVRPADVWVVVGLGAVIVAAVWFTGRALFATVVDEESSRVAGLPVDRLNTMLSVLTAVTIVAAMRVVGLLLVAALMVLPVGASRLVARSFRGMLLGAVGVGTASVVVGLVVRPDLGPRAGRHHRAGRRRRVRRDVARDERPSPRPPTRSRGGTGNAPAAGGPR